MNKACQLCKMVSVLFLLIFLSLASAAPVDYQAAADDISQRLDKAAQQYQAGNITEAKRTVQMAYFDVYEGIEGPIRINYSAQYSAELEGKFGEIRKLIASKSPVENVKKAIAWLKAEINSLPEKLTQGHQLVAEKSGLDANSIAPEWQQIANQINDSINGAVWSYKSNEQEKALKSIEEALTTYTASGLPKSLAENGKASVNADIIANFSEMTRQMKLNPQETAKRQKQVKQIAYQGYLITQALGDELPGLPASNASSASHSASTATIATTAANAEATKTAETASTDTTAAVATTGETTQPAASNKATNNHNWHEVNTQILAAVDTAIATYQTGDSDKAIDDLQNTYFDVFEATGYENAIGAKDGNFKAQLESYFTKMVGLMSAKRPVEDLVAVRNAQEADLIKAANQLGHSPTTFWEVAIQAFLILIREGLEAMLVVAAIAAYLVKNEHQDKMWVVKQSVGVGLLASLVTAYVFKILFTASGVNREILEGVTMLIAVVVLFFMSYWLLSKVEARQWQAYLKNKLSHSLTTGSIVGLWLASFLAIYREGAETVLFYFALSAGVPDGGVTGILAGVVAATAVLLIAYYVMRYTVVQLPLKPFFLFTGAFMYVMAFIFAGKGVMELAEGKVFTPTIVSSVPEIQWLGIYPYAQSLAPQVLLILAAIAAWIVVKLRANRA